MWDYRVLVLFGHNQLAVVTPTISGSHSARALRNKLTCPM